MSRKKDTITLSIFPETKEQLEAIARHFNIFWGKSPSLSGLITAIAQHKLEVGQPFALNSVQVQALRQAIKALIDSGQIEEAQTLIELLLERGSPEEPLRQSLLEQISQPTETWRKVLDRQIEKKQPFLLLYRNSQGEKETFTIRYADIKFFEKRFYLEAWCEEIAGSQEVPELVHNRCFRLERIINLLPVNTFWRENLDHVILQLHFRGWLVKAYEPKADDIEDRVVDGIRQVTRRVSNSFWLIREISRYWEDCVIVSPESVRSRLKDKLKAMKQQYNL
ncbi:MAG: helix-turn-helix transcriptional regulator [Xenococcaceae cyanobacterium]